MAKLPPKIPNMTPTWPELSHQKMPPIAANINSNTQNPSWVDEFLNFSSARRENRRRSVNDSIAFLEAPILDECCGSGAVPGSRNKNEFDKFDDEQFMSMFTEDLPNAVAPTVSSSNPSSPSDHNSINDEKDTTPSDRKKQIWNESDEVQSQCKTESQAPPNTATDNYCDRMADPKRVKRILANRKSAQRSRVRKLQYISELERSVTSLQGEVSVLSPRVAFLEHQRLLLNVDNGALKQRIAALAQDKIFKDAHQEALKREIERLSQVYHQQSLKKMENAGASPAPVPAQSAEAKPSMPMENKQLPNV